MKEGFTFNKVSLMFLRKVIGGGGEQKTAVKLYNSLPFIKHGREKTTYTIT